MHNKKVAQASCLVHDMFGVIIVLETRGIWSSHAKVRHACDQKGVVDLSQQAGVQCDTQLQFLHLACRESIKTKDCVLAT